MAAKKAKTATKKNRAGRTRDEEYARVDKWIEFSEAQRAEITSQVKKAQASRPPAYTSPVLFACRLAAYIRDCYEQGAPILVNGFYRASGLPERTWYDYQRGDRDHITDKVLTQDGRPLQSREGEEAVQKAIASFMADDTIFPYLYQVYTGIPPADTDTARDYFVEELNSSSYRSCFSQIAQNARLNLHADVEQHLVGGKIGDIMRAKVILGWQDEKTTVHRIELDNGEKEERLTLLEG